MKRRRKARPLRAKVADLFAWRSALGRFFGAFFLLLLGLLAFALLVKGFPGVRHPTFPWPFFLGFIAYLLVHLFWYRPVLSYVLAHELSHALTAVLLGGKVSAIHASASGGSAKVSERHWVVALAPYVLPFYTLLLLSVYAVASLRFKPWLLALLGFSYAFHVVLTVVSLSRRQPDLDAMGRPFSLIFIFSGNMMILVLLAALLWPQAYAWKALGRGALEILIAGFEFLRKFSLSGAPR